MAFFDQMSMGDPQTMALLGALAGVSQFAGASRLPQTFGQALGGGAQGLMMGQQQALNTQQARQKLGQGAIQNYMALDQARRQAAALGQPMPTMQDLMSGSYTGPNYTQAFQDFLNPTAPQSAPQLPNAGTMLPQMLPSASAAAGLPTAPLPPSFDLAPLTQTIHQLESNGKIDNVPDSSAGAIGPMQVMPSTAAGYGVGAAALRQPSVNLAVGGQYIHDLYQKYQDPEAVAVAYNGGPSRADQWLSADRDASVLPKETQNYLTNFRTTYPQYAQAQPQTATDAGSAFAMPQTGGTPQAGMVDPRTLAAAQIRASALGLGKTGNPVLDATFLQSMMPRGTPAYNLLGASAAHSAGIEPVIGGGRPGSAGYVFSGFDAQGRPQYTVGFQNPNLGPGQMYNPATNSTYMPNNYLQNQAAIESNKEWAGVPPKLYGQGIAVQPGGGVAPVPNFSQTMGGIKGAEAGAATTATNQANFGGLLPGGAFPGGAGPSATAPQAAAPSAPPITLPGVAPGTPVPLSVAANNMTARIYHPVDTGRGTLIPPLNQQVIPQSAEELKAAIPKWTEKQTEWNNSIAPAQAATQRLNSIANAFKMIETGAFQTDRAAFASALRLAGLPDTLTDPGQVEIALHSNIVSTLQTLKSTNPRFAQSEFKTLSQNSEHPNLQPEANLELLSQDLATLARSQQLSQDWNTAQQLGWKNPLSFETNWTAQNPLSNMVQWQRQNIGPLKGMPGAATHVNPQTGQKIYQQGGQWFDATTNQPLAPASPSVPIR